MSFRSECNESRNLIIEAMKYFFVILFLVCAVAARGQQIPSLNPMQTGEIAPPQGNVDLDENGNPIVEQNADSTKKVRPKRPLQSYFFDDSIKKERFFAWHVNTWRNAVRMTPIDTALNSTQPHHPLVSHHGAAWQGNLGGAVMPLDYAERADYQYFAFAQGFDAYNITPERATFYNVKTPMTFLSYYMSGPAKRYEEDFHITHAQNISPSSGFNIDYGSQGTRGFYAWSKGRAKNLSIAFSHTGRKYTVHGGYIYNTNNNKENGGIVNDRFITDTIFELPEAIPVKLNDARNVLKGNTLYITQSFGAPLRRTDDSVSIAGYSSVFVGHSMEWSRWTKKYTDTREQTTYNQLLTGDWDNTVEQEFYSDWRLDPFSTRDSISETKFSNRLFVQIQPYDREGVIGLIDAGVGVDNHRYYMFRPRQYLTGREEAVTETDYYVYGAVDGRVSRYFRWGADGRLHPTGERKGNYRIGANASLSAFVRERELTLSGELYTELRDPAYWHEHLLSNHFAWENSFNAERQTRLAVRFAVPSWNLEMGGTQSIATDKIYYDASARPAQRGGNVSVTGAYVDKLFSLGGWRLRHRVLLQKSSDQVAIPTPAVTAYVSYSFEFDVVKNALRARVGIDAYYNTPYYAPGWMPATAQFYNQREKELGGYPLVDAFITARWKRMRILLKMEHVNENLFGSRNYFTALHYPLQKRVFKLGFTWAFYD